mmetsp:Transcript_67667/g.177474  ORF Transcript_67667/g.177474 Transcript_67667/m.177474 type:complete len:214 (-) Transcript_67667:48-689(-)
MAQPMMRPRKTRSSSAAMVLLALAAAAILLCVSESESFARVKNGPRKVKMNVVLLKDQDNIGMAGEQVAVARGYFRNYLFPRGIARKQDAKLMTELKKASDEKDSVLLAALAKAMEAKEKIEGAGTLVFEKKVREGTKKIYGSLTQTDVAEALVIKTGYPVRITSVVIPKVTECGKYTGTVELGNDITAFFEIKVTGDGAPEETEEGAAPAEE